MRGQGAPPEPTLAERLAHGITHRPRGTWCKLCVTGKCRDQRRRAQEERPTGPGSRFRPAYALDGSELEKCTGFTVVEEDLGSTQPIYCGLRCSDDRYAVMAIKTILDRPGRADRQLLCDQEPSLSDVALAFEAKRPVETTAKAISKAS